MIFLAFLKRIFTNKAYWLAVLITILLLMCSNIYKDTLTGKEYIFLSLFYDMVPRQAMEFGNVSLEKILFGPDTGYLWMFCPIIVGMPCVLLNKTDRLVLFRSSKMGYVVSKSAAVLITGGLVLVIAYFVFGLIGMVVMHHNIWNIYFVKKLLSVFCQGIFCALPSVVLSEIVRNKYLILCIPYVINYFTIMFLTGIIPGRIGRCIDPSAYGNLFLGTKEQVVPCVITLVSAVGVCLLWNVIRLGSRCDCGQK